MSFAVEAPGAASPLTRVELIRTLQSASSGDNTKRKAADQQLSAWSGHEDYYPSLQDVFLDKSLPREVRLMAAIGLKNGIEVAWRFHTSSGIRPQQKSHIRSNLFRGTIGEQDSQLALYNAITIAKIVRIDYPKDWPEALDELLAQIEASRNDEHLLSGGLQIMLRIVKELSSARLQRSQRALQLAAPPLVQTLANIYDAKAREWMTIISSGQDESTNVGPAMDNSLVALRILRRLLVMGYDTPYKYEIARQVWTFSQSQLGQLGTMVNDKYPAIGLHLLQITKLHLSMARTHPGSFAALPGSSELVHAYWHLVSQFSLVYDQSEGLRPGDSSDEKFKGEGPLQERVALKGLLLMRAAFKFSHHPVQSIKYRSKEDVQQEKEAVKQLKQTVFSDEFVSQMAQTIITRFMLFRKADLEAWEEDPQEWQYRMGTDSEAYDWEVGPCAGRLFLDLLCQYRSLLLSPLLAYFNTVRDPQASIIAKEAVYSVMGLSVAQVEDEYDFNALLGSAIVADAQIVDPLCKILRRRIAMLIGQWSPIKYTDETRSLVPQIFGHFLNPNDPHNDIVVRLTAAKHFDDVIGDWGFNVDAFIPMAGDFIKELIHLIQMAELPETKMDIIDTLRGLITRLDTAVPQFSDIIMNALPALWTSTGVEGLMLKTSILVIMDTLVSTMKSEWIRYHDIMVPLVAENLDGQNPNSINLVEDTLDLWAMMIQHSQPQLSPALLGLVPIAVNGLEEQTGHDRLFMQVLGCYLCLTPRTLLEDANRQPALKALSASLQSRTPEMVKQASKYIQILMRFSHQIGGEQGFQLLMRDAVDTGLFRWLLKGIHDSYKANQATGPKRPTPSRPPQLLIHNFDLLSRIALIDPATFAAMLAALGPVEGTWPWLSAEWFSSFDTIAELEGIKLNFLGMTRLLELPQPMAGFVITKLQDYLSMWTSVISQLWDTDQPGHDKLVLTRSITPGEWDTRKDAVERELLQTDPVKTVPCHDFVKERLQKLPEIVGDSIFQEWLSNVDKDVLEGFQNMESRNGGP
ncbi:putative importin 11 [Poronia punctata]|nr:putative importin 11 [Poronia punctata]